MLFLLALKSSGLWKIDGEASVIGEEHVILSTEQLLDLRRIRRARAAVFITQNLLSSAVGCDVLSVALAKNLLTG